MRYHWWTYERPESVNDAVALLAKYQGQAKLIAGGTDLLVHLDREDKVIPAVVDITSISSLDQIIEREEYWEIGAGTTLSQIEQHKPLSELAHHLIEAIEVIGSVQIRNVATLVGNITNGSPAADGVLPLLTLDVGVIISSSEGQRIVPLENFFIGPRSTVCGPIEMVVGLRVPKSTGHWIGSFEKVGLRQAMAIAVVNMATNVSWVNGKVADVRLAVGAVAPTPLLVKDVSLCLLGTSLEDEFIEQASLIAKEVASPIDDVRASASYRRKMVKALTIRCLRRIRNQAQDEVRMTTGS